MFRWKLLPMNFKTLTHDIKQKPAAAFLAILTTALAVVSTFLVITLYLADHDTDRKVPEHQRLYRIESQFNLPNGDRVRSARVPFPLVGALENNADIESVGYAYRLESSLHQRGKIVPRIPLFAVTPTFMALLHPYLHDLPVPGPHEIYITADFNRQYTRLDNPLGKTLSLGDLGLFTIKAIVEPRPDSSLRLPAIIAFSPERVAGYQDKRHDWYDTHIYAFARLPPSRLNFDQQLLADIVSHKATALPGAPFTPSSFLTFRAKNILDMHYDDGYGDEFVTPRARSLLYMLYAAAGFVLFSTLVNFFAINGVLNTARRPAQQIKRSLGASNSQILVESLSLFFAPFLAAILLAIIFIYLLLQVSPEVSTLLTHQSAMRLLILFSGVVLFVGGMLLTASLLSLSLFIFGRQALHRPGRYQNQWGEIISRMILLLQLVVAGTAVYLWAGVMTQNHALTQADFGYQRTHRLTFSLDEGFSSVASLRALQHRLEETTGALAVSLSSWQPFDLSRQQMHVRHAQQPVNGQFTTINTLSADKYFSDVWGLTTLAGQEHALQASNDDSVCHAIVTRAFMQAMGQKTFNEVLNTRYYLPSDERQRELRVLRVVENFDLGEHLLPPQPLIVFINDRLEKFATVAYAKKQDEEGIIRQLRQDGYGQLAVQTVQALHQRHFYNDAQMLSIMTFIATLALIFMVVSILVSSLSEAQRLNRTLKIMEAVGGSIATSLVFFLERNVLPVLLTLLTAWLIGGVILRQWLQSYHFVAGLVYVNAFAALLLLSLLLVAIMTLSLVLWGGRMTRFRLRRK